MRGRPMLFTSYADDQALLNTTTKKVATAVFVFLLILVPFQVLPGLRFLGENDWLRLLSTVAIFAVAGLGLNIIFGFAGQVSLGHAFFMGLGAYTAAILGGAEGTPHIGFGLPIWIWLPAAGIVAALVGIVVAPIAVRVRGLYLAIVTLGLVFVGEYIFRNLKSITGGAETGRRFPKLDIRIWKEQEAFIPLSTDGSFLGVGLASEAKIYFFVILLAALFVVAAKNLQRTRLGRAFQAIRDRDVAAEIMGVDEFGYKLRAFGISSFYAGVAGALLASFVGSVIPARWDLFLSVQILAIVLIGGAGSVAGTVLGAAFVTLLPRIVQDFTLMLEDVVETGEGIAARALDLVIATEPSDFGLVNSLPGVGPGLSVFQLNQVVYGFLIIGFLIFEPLGLYGIWIRVRNYWTGWPFTY